MIIMKGAIFDLDGTLIDSMNVWNKIDDDLLRGYGFAPDEAYHLAITNLTFTEGAEYIVRRFNLECTPREILTQINEMALHEYSENIRLKSGVKEYLNTLQKRGVRLLLGTSCIKELCEAVLKSNDIFSFFEDFVYSADIPEGKRSPVFYKICAERLGLKCNECCVFEDSLFAVESAKKAGCSTIGVYEEFFVNDADKLRAAADRFIFSFNDLL